MYSGDKVPELSKTRPFPHGDIVDRAKERKVNDWFESIEKMDRQQFVSHISQNHAPAPLPGKVGRYTNYQVALRMCRAWDMARRQNNFFTQSGFFAQSGYVLSLSFNSQTQYLPPFDINLSTELTQMQHNDEQLHRARSFAQVAWRSISTYPRIHTTYDRLLDHAKTRYDLIPEENADHFMAGMALPFMMSYTSQLVEGTPDFTGLTTERHDLRRVEFSSLFTDKIALAPDIIVPESYSS